MKLHLNQRPHLHVGLEVSNIGDALGNHRGPSPAGVVEDLNRYHLSLGRNAIDRDPEKIITDDGADDDGSVGVGVQLIPVDEDSPAIS